MRNSPQVSVVMSVYNGEDYLSESIDSILRQTFEDFEFIIVDDASSDSTSRILAGYHDARLHILTNDARLGLTRSLNRALSAAKGRLIARQDADDVSLAERLACQVEWLDSNPAVGVLGSDLDIIDTNGRSIGRFGIETAHAQIVWRMFYGRVLAHPSVMFRDDVVRAAGGYDPNVEVAQDLDLWSRLVGKTRFASLPQRLVRYRSHTGAVSVRRAQTQRGVVLAVRARLASNLLGTEVTPADVVALEAALTGSGDAKGLALARDLLDALEQAQVFTAAEVDFIADGLRYRPLRNLLIAGARARLGSVRRKLLTTPHDGEPHGIQRPGVAGVTVVVLTYHRPDGLNALLASIAAQDRGDLGLEVIICNNASSRRLGGMRHRRRLKGLMDLKVVDSSYNWACSVRYAFATMAKYETVLFLDDDMELLDAGFIRQMYDHFTSLEPQDILSCWTTIWADCNDAGFSTVSLTFMADDAPRSVEVDTVGPGISMFRRDTILHPEVFAEITSPRFPKTDDMAFGIATSMKLGTRKYFMPSYGMVRIHRQARTRALATREGRDADLFAYYKQALSEGFRPLLLRQKQQGLGEETLEHRLAQSLPRQAFRW